MLYSNRYRCIFVHVPKCAGTSVEKTLGLQFVLAKTWPFTEQRWHCTRRATIQKLGEERWNAYFRFSFVRNPFDRIVSAWRKFETKSWCKLDRSYSLPQFVDVVLNDRIGYVANYRNSLTKALWQRSLENVRHHTLPVTHPYYGLFEGGSLNVQFCGRFETLGEDFNHVAKRLGHPLKLSHELRTIRSTDYREYYKDVGLVRALADYYRDDCRYFNYEF